MLPTRGVGGCRADGPVERAKAAAPALAGYCDCNQAKMSKLFGTYFECYHALFRLKLGISIWYYSIFVCT